MLALLVDLFDTSGFPPRWHCGTWSAEMGWLHILSDVAVFGAYTAIPVVLAYFVLRKPDVPFPKIFWLFVAFIFACGFGHLLEAIIFWEPVYRLAGAVKLTTAVVSWATVLALVYVVPQALHLPGLAKLNDELRGEVDERRRVEAALRTSEGQLAQLLESERSARGDAERANRIKDEFLSTVSHELRTPLHAILGYAQLLMHGAADGEQREGLAVIERNAKAQAQIIDDLLDTSRILSGKVRLDAKTVDMVEVVEAALATVRPAAEAKNIRLQVVLDPNAGPVLGDSGRLQQVLWNLLANAIKFTSKEGRIQVTMERVNSHLELRVADNGQGIRPEFLPHVFDRFQQADGGITRKHGGLGLGLSIVKHLVELHGGTVTAHSAGVGCGATFTINLPVQVVHEERRSADASQAHPADRAIDSDVSLAGVRVLVVDDESDGRELVNQLLTRYGAEVETVASGDEALRAIQRRTPHILISDIGMPEMDGYDLMRQVRALPGPAGMIPAAALTALVRSQDRMRALFAGFQAHIAKPVEPAELVAVVATLTGRTGKSSSESSEAQT
jgi:signal transduction histidine kinase/ActR/RegA family two-component response regulator